ncbi:MAG: hypothetical protein IJ092_06265 [Atopobiaceae bacterium]|nr:hypothetical protein [Atopobiaceae bacterium]
MAVGIRWAPNERVADLVRPTRNDNEMTSSWRTSSWSTNDDNNRRFQGIDAWFIFNASWYKPKKSVESRSSQRYVYGDVVWVRDGEMMTEFTQRYDRNAYHPVKPGRYLNSVTVQAAGWNERGFGPRVSQSYWFGLPRAPKVAVPEVNPDNGTLMCEITPAKKDDTLERYDTQYCVIRQDSANRNNAFKKAQMVTKVSGKPSWVTTRTDDPINTEYDLWECGTLGINQWVKFTIRAISRGLKGNSAVSERTHVFAYPHYGTITQITHTDLGPGGVLTVRVSVGDANSRAYRPVDEVKLQMLRNTDAATVAEAAFADGWSDVDGAVDDDGTFGFSVPVTNAMPDRGKRTWFRAVTKHDILTLNGAPYQAAQLYRAAPTAEDDVVTVDSVTSGADGESLVVVLGWSNDDSTGTEVSWSAKGDAWESTEPPSTFQVTWKDPASKVAGKANSASLVIRGLEEGEPVYVKARRYLERESGTSYGKYATPAAAQFPAIPATRPSDLVLTAPGFVTRGSGIPLTWTYNGGEQTSWAVYSMPGRKALAGGDGTAGSCTVPSPDDDESLRLLVSVTTGGEWTDSNEAEVSIADAPTVGVEVAPELASQPVEAAVTSDSADTRLVMVLRADGVSMGTPSGVEVQAEGDVLWSDVVTPEWVESEGGYSAEVTLPSGLALVNTASYTLTAKAVSTVTGLSSEEAEAAFTVAWSHTAGVPSGTVEADGSLMRARIAVTAPEGALEGDTCDVYRRTPDGSYLIASDVAFGSTVIDRYAPYGGVDLYYRLATRTADGDTEFTDVKYELPGHGMRFDWAKRSLALPYNVEHSDSWAKDFEERQHLDGSVAGRWNPAVSRRVKLDSDVIRKLGSAEMELVRELAQYPGAVFVRLSNGCAFEANVDVDEVRGSSSAAIPVSLTATEVGLTEEFMVPIDAVIEAGSDHSEYGD